MKQLFNITTDNETNLKVCRFLFYLLLVCLLSPQHFLGLSIQVPRELWQPSGLLSFFSQPIPISQELNHILSFIWYALAIVCALGVKPFFTTKIFFILTLFILNMGQSYGHVSHTFMPLSLVAFIFAFGGKHKIFLARFIFCAVFFSAGLSKMRNSGLDWITSESIENMVLRSPILFHDIHSWAVSLKIYLEAARFPILLKTLAAAAVLLELLSPLALITRKAITPIVLGLLVMQFAIYFLLLTSFKFYAVLYIFWINWEWLANKLEIQTP